MTEKKNGLLKDSFRGTPASGIFSWASSPSSDISNVILLTTLEGTETFVNTAHILRVLQKDKMKAQILHLVYSEGLDVAELAELSLGA